MTKRLITIDSRGPIPQKGSVYGPITKPYLEDVRVIARMLVGRIAVTEHTDDGGKRALTIKDIPELTAQAPRIIKPNVLEQKDRSALIELAEKKKQEAKAEREAQRQALESKEQKEEKVEEVETPQQQPKSSLSKKERRALEAKKAAEKAEGQEAPQE